MLDNKHNQLPRLIEAVHTSRKYKDVSEAFVRSIGARELARRGNLKEAVKATKNKLHQVGAAYLDGETRYASWLEEIKVAALSGDEQELRKACMSVMLHHSSMRERVPILEEFYATTLADIQPVRTVLDIACGLHPLALPWMPFRDQVTYYAYDIYQDMVDFLNAFLSLVHVQGNAQVCDVIQCCPTQRADVAFILKALPCLEQVDRDAGLRLLSQLNADHLLVSFPAQSLGGRKRGMLTGYEARFQRLVAGMGWSIKRFEFATELAFLITR